MIETRDYERWTALEMAELVRARQVTAEELAGACRELIEERNPRLNAVADEGPAVDMPAADPRVAFPGVPFAVKEVLAAPGLRWTMGSRMLASAPAGEPSPYVRRLMAAGLRIVCSTTSSEFGLVGSTEGLLHGATANPWAPGLSAAGSSGGSAALVAAGVLPMAHASDAGGSIRVPASVTGLFGFKPSKGRTVEATPADGLGALIADHCVSRTVADSAALLTVTSHRGSPAPSSPIGDVCERPLPRLRIGVVERTLMGELPDHRVGAELAGARRLCEDLGHETIELDLRSVDGQAVSDAFFDLASLTMARMADLMAGPLGGRPGSAELEPFTLELIDHAQTLPPNAGETCMAAIRTSAAAYVQLFDGCDAILSPTLARLPWPIGYLDPCIGREELIRRTESIIGYTPIQNISGSPAMSVPLGWVDGLPVGMHFAAAPGQDELLLGLALELEAARPWHDKRPDLATAAV
jgi:amidase